MKEFINRLVWFIVLLFMSSLFPWWLVVLFLVALSFIFENYFEIVLVGVVYDVLFFSPGLPWYISISHTGVAVLIYCAMLLVHKYTRKPNILL